MSGNVMYTAHPNQKVTGLNSINNYYDKTLCKIENETRDWSTLKWVIKSKNSICPTEYFISSDTLETWRLEGTTVNGRIELLHAVCRKPFVPGKFEMRRYPLKTNNKFKSFRIIQEDSIYHEPKNSLEVSVFDFSGIIY